MIFCRRSLFLLIALLLSNGAASAQVPTGTPAFGSFSGGPDIINLANLNSHISFPFFLRAGRGKDFTYAMSYDTSVWYPVGVSGSQTWQPIYNWGWRGQTEVIAGYISYTTQKVNCYDNQHNLRLAATQYKNWVYHDPMGIPHSYTGMTTVIQTPCPSGSTSFTQTSSDGSGLTLNATGSVGTLTTADGKIVHPPVVISSQAGTATDRNGNQITASSSGVFTDTLGTTALTVSGVAPSPTTFTYTAPFGSNATYTMKYTTLTVQTNFGCSGINEYGPTSNNLVTEIDLPDWNATTNPNAKYSFAYEQTPGGSGNVTGRLSSVTLPTGGTISYAYVGGSNGITCADGSTSGLQRFTPDTGSNYWNYARSGIAPAYTTTITDPQGNQTVVQFQGIYETQRQTYQGSTSGILLQTTNTCYNGAASPCTGTAITLPITRKTQLIGYPDNTGRVCMHDQFFDSYGLQTEQDDYDYGTGAPASSPLRKLINVYNRSLTNGIVSMPSSITVCNGSGTSSSCTGPSGSSTGTVVAQTSFAYDETSVAVPIGTTPQHSSVTGSRGNATTIKKLVQGTTFLTSTISYFDTGNPQTITGVNNAATTFSYPDATSTCGNAFPTSITEPLNLSRSMTWNCSGAVQTSLKDENGQSTGATTSWSYTTDAFFWRPEKITDTTGAVTNFYYPTSAPYNWVESKMTFNGNNSVVDQLTIIDTLGRAHLQQTWQGPSAPNYDTVETDYDALGRVSRVTLPYSGTNGQTNSSAPAITTTYDALGRSQVVTDAGNGTATYTYNRNDTLIAVGPAPTSENSKQRQLEYDSLGRLVSVCEITSVSPSGTCGQQTAASGYLTNYGYDALGNLTGVTQNNQPGGTPQSRSYSFDGLSRLTSKTNPESGTTSYTYDSATGCTGTFNGDLVKRVDAVGNSSCYAYDVLHRNTSITYSGPYASVTPSKYFVYDTATLNGAAMANAKSRLAEAYTCTTCPGTKITDLGFSYTARGEASDVYELTPHSNPSYYHATQSYWPHGAPYMLSATVGGASITGFPNITYGGTIGTTVGLDGEGRITQVTAASGQNPVTATAYNVASLPTQVTYGSADMDIFGYDPNTLRMNSYQFKVGAQSVSGTLGWNANGSLGTLGIADPFNTANTQNCSYAADDLSRITKADCGTIWGQTFSYDPFGNITKNKINGSNATSFTPTYQTSPITNRVSTVGGVSATYDANGNSTFDTFRHYTWDADGNSVTIGSATLTYDAFDRMVEQTVGSTNSEVVYGPSGGKLALMNGTGGATLIKAFVPVTGGATAVYTSSGLAYYRHTDHLHTSRLASTPTNTVYSDTAYSAFGEPYAEVGADPSFTGQNQDTTAGLYDFLFREQDPNQGRWASPDPAGLAAASLGDPQSFNGYSYARNMPTILTDALGLCPWRGCPGQVGGAGQTYNTCYLNGVTVDCSILMSATEAGATEASSLMSGPSVDNTFQVWMSGGCVTTTDNGNNGASGGGQVQSSSGTSCQSGQWSTISFGDGGNSSGGGSTLDDRANALARALNKTGVQSLANPCTPAAWYLASFVGGSGVAAGMSAAAVGEAAAAYWPNAVNAAFRWLYKNSLTHGPGLVAYIGAAKNLAQGAQNGCNSLQ